MADYALEGPRWGSGAQGTAAGVVTWAVDNTISASFASLFSAAFADWAQYANISFQQITATASANIAFTEAAIDGLDNVLGQTDYYYTTGSGAETFTSTTITFDTGEGWHTSGNTIVSNDSVNLFVVALHEIGHAIGLDHYNAAPAVMNAYVDRSVADLTSSEIDGIQALYGVKATVGEIRGSVAADSLVGTAGADRIVGQAGNDTISGGDGGDLIYGNAGADYLHGDAGNDTLFGGQGSDTLYGDSGANIIYGNAGNDVLYGGPNGDTIYGGAGADTLVAGAGVELLIGGVGADRYSFAQGSGADTIRGFNQSEGDRIALGGQTYTLSSSSAGDAVLTLSGGGSIDLVGIHANQVSTSFFA